jgi:hypothetical protein
VPTNRSTTHGRHTMTTKPNTTPAGIVVSTGIVGGPKKIFIGGIS